MRRLLFAAAVVLVATSPEVGAAEAAAGRYELAPSDNGFIRLDTGTGATSHCGEKGGVWYCEPLAEAGGATAARLDALTGEVAELAAALSALTARFDALTARLDQLAALPAVAEAPPEAGARPGFIATVMQRFLDMVRGIKHGAGREA